MLILDVAEMERGGPVPRHRWLCPDCGDAVWTVPLGRVRAPACEDCGVPTEHDNLQAAKARGDAEAVAEFERVAEVYESTSPEERRGRTKAAIHREKVAGDDWKPYRSPTEEEVNQSVRRALARKYRPYHLR